MVDIKMVIAQKKNVWWDFYRDGIDDIELVILLCWFCRWNGKSDLMILAMFILELLVQGISYCGIGKLSSHIVSLMDFLKWVRLGEFSIDRN